MIEKHEDPAGDGNLNNVENDAYIELRNTKTPQGTETQSLYYLHRLTRLRNTKTPQGTETQRLLCTLCKTLAIEKHEDPAGDGNFYTACHRAYRCSIEKHEDPAGDGNRFQGLTIEQVVLD